MDEQPIRVGIIGAGRVGVDWHLPGLRAAGAEAVAIADSVPGRAAKFAQSQSIRHAFGDWRDLLDDESVDVVAICTPPVMHAEMAVAALDAGKHIYLEKPATLDAAQMQAVAEASARRPDQRLIIGSHYIFHPQTRLIRRGVAEGRLGRVFHVEALRNLRYNVRHGWQRVRAIAGGGTLMDSCTHRLEMVLFMLGDPGIESVTARTYDLFAGASTELKPKGQYKIMDLSEGEIAEEPECDVEDSVVAMIHLRGEAGPITFMLRDMSIAHAPSESRVQLYGTERGTRFQLPVPWYRASPEGVQETKEDLERPALTHELPWRHLVDCIRNGQPTDSTPQRALNVMRIVDAINASASANGKQIDLRSAS